MRRKNALINLLIGKERIEGRVEYKQAILRGQLGLLVLVICSIYMIVDPINGIYMFLPYYLATAFIAVMAIFLNRIRRFTLSSSILLLTSNILVYIIADAGKLDRGVFLFFIATAVTGLVLFYHSNLILGVLFALLSIALALLAYYFNLNLFHLPQEHDALTKINFAINFTLGILSTVMVVVFVIKRNKESENSLIESKQSLENLTTELQEKNNALQKANDELDRFVYSSSHDLRAPLSTLLGLINIMKISEDKDEVASYLEMMVDRIEDMELFIKDITDYARNSRLEISSERINVYDFIDGVINTFTFEANKEGIRIENNINHELAINTDSKRCKVIINNLINNAIKYHDPTKEDRYIKLTASSNGSSCKLEFEDNGIGIENEYQNKIFQMFYRATEKSTGSGLGLYIVKESLNKMGGEISFQSEKGKGSKFVVTI